MPGTIQAGDELRQPAITLDEEMRGNLQGCDLGEERMLVHGQAVLKERLHLAGAELPWRQADVVHHQQRYLATGASVEIRRWAVRDALKPASGRVELHVALLNVSPL